MRLHNEMKTRKIVGRVRFVYGTERGVRPESDPMQALLGFLAKCKPVAAENGTKRSQGTRPR